MIAQNHPRVALCFIDVCNFTILSSTMTAQGIVYFLDRYFTLIDDELSKYKNIVKIKTIGDSYFAVAGLQNDVKPHDSTDNTDSSSNNNDDNRRQHRATTDVVVDEQQTVLDLIALVEFCFSIQSIVAAHQFQVPANFRRQSPMLAEPAAEPRVPASPEFAVALADDDDERVRCRRALQDMLRDDDGHFAIKLRIGIDTGNVVAGVVGKKQPVRLS